LVIAHFLGEGAVPLANVGRDVGDVLRGHRGVDRRNLVLGKFGAAHGW
jgi:hypothetical protein